MIDFIGGVGVSAILWRPKRLTLFRHQDLSDDRDRRSRYLKPGVAAFGLIERLDRLAWPLRILLGMSKLEQVARRWGGSERCGWFFGFEEDRAGALGTRQAEAD